MSRVLAVVLLVAGVGTATAGPDPKKTLDAVDQAYASVKGATLDFAQTVTSVTFGDKKKSAGSMWIERPGKLRWEYKQTRKGATKTTKVFVTDGKTVTMIDMPNRRAEQGPLCANLTPAAMSFLTGKGKLSDSFTPSVAASTTTTIDLELTPIAKTAQYTKVVLTVDASTFLVQKSVVTDTAGNTNEFAFSNVNTSATVAASLFKVNLKDLRNKNFAVTKHTGSCPKTASTSTASGAGSGSGSGTASAGASAGTGSSGRAE